MTGFLFDKEDDPADWINPDLREEYRAEVSEKEIAAIEARRAKRRKSAKQKELAEFLLPILHKRIAPKVHCTVCRSHIPDANGKTRRCDTCLANKRSATTVKYCRLCRAPAVREFHEGNWATWAVCDRCRGSHLEVYSKAKKAATAAAAAAMSILDD